MKTIKCAIFALAGSLLFSCSDLDLSPKDSAASGSWFQTPEQFELNLNALLHHSYWPMERNEWTSNEQTELDMLTDDGQNRSAPGRFLIDGVDGTYPLAVRMWDITYTGINRCNKIITEIKKLEGEMDPERYNRIIACARFYRACFYCRIIMHFGDPVVVPEDMDMDSEAGRQAAYELTRTDMWEVVDDMLREFDEIAPLLPVSYGGGEVERATQGAVYGMKARYALHFASIRKWDTVELDENGRGHGFGDANEEEAKRLFKQARDAAANCMVLNAYTLHSDFGELFRMSTKHSPEGIFVIPRSKALSNNSKYQYLYGGATKAKLPRLSGAPTCTTCLPGFFGSNCQQCKPCNHGKCDDGLSGTGQCICDEGWSPSGVCNTCAEGYFGARCEACESCNGHGKCLDGHFGSGECDCDSGFDAAARCADCKSGFWGRECKEQCPMNEEGEVCSGQGTCSDRMYGTGRCECKEGFVGVKCDTLFENDKCDPHCQTGKGACDEEKAVCVCYDHFFGKDCRYSPSIMLISVGLTVLVVIVVVVVLVFVLYIKKKRNSNPRSFKIVDNTPLLNAV